MKRSSIKVGTRGSPLALAQTQLVISKLQEAHPRVKFVPVVIRTTGDRIASATALRKAGKGVFVKELERALLRRKIDCAVHSLKDMPTELPAGLEFGAVLERGEAADVFIGREGVTIDKLPPRSVVGTASLRRQALLRATYPAIEVEDLRGNLDSRLSKLNGARSRLGGIVVAAAGLQRLMGESAPAHQLLPKNVLVPAAGQGALAIEIRAGHADMRRLLEPIHHAPTAAAVAAERALLKRLEGGCNVPLGVHAEAGDDGLVRVMAAMAAPDGSQLIRSEATGSVDDPDSVAAALETMMRNRGADAILDELRVGGRRPKAASNGHRRRNGRPKRGRRTVRRRGRARRR